MGRHPATEKPSESFDPSITLTAVYVIENMTGNPDVTPLP